MAEEFVPLPKAAEELGVTPEALKQVIAKRELAAFLDGGTFKIRRSDLDRYKARRQSEETVVLPAEEVAEEVEEIVEGEVVAEAVILEEPTMEAIEETAETVDTEITLDELETVQEEPPTGAIAEEPSAVELASETEPTQEVTVGDDLAFSDEVTFEDEGAKTVSLEAGGKASTQPLEVGQEGGDDLDEAEPLGGEGEGLEARTYVLEARQQGSAWAAALMVLTAMLLLYVGMALWGFPLDYVPSYLEWIVKP